MGNEGTDISALLFRMEIDELRFTEVLWAPWDQALLTVKLQRVSLLTPPALVAVVGVFLSWVDSHNPVCIYGRGGAECLSHMVN
jgi:hypothetical protein